jgi:DNA-binding transcriptional regulator YiaG
MAKKYQSELLGVLHQDASADYQLGIISEAKMREFDHECLIRKPDQAPESTPGTRHSPTPAYTSPRRA